MQVDMSEFHSIFFDEAAEHLAMMEEGLLGLEATPHNLDLLNSIFRCAHSIKGNSLMLALNEIGAFTHVMESLLDRMREGKIEARPEYVNLLLQATDVLGTLLAAAKGESPPPADVDQVVRKLNEVLKATEGNPQPVAAGAAAENPLEQAHHCTERLAEVHPSPENGQPLELEESVTAEQSVATAQHEDSQELAALASHDEADSGIATAASSAGVQALQPSAPKSSGAGHSESSSIRVSVEKVDELINLVGELAIAQSMVNQAIRNLPIDIVPMLEEAMKAMERSTREIQERVMSVRMLPVGTIFRRFPRLVRDLAGSLGKQVTLEIVGEDTELDKQVIEQISDPLTHLVRNAIDHGLEGPEERLSRGKPEAGCLRLVAFHEGGNVIIDVIEDGRGLDKEKIRAKALSQGLIGPNDNLTEDEIHDLVFRPGFSTAAAVSDISGRGVGMDVVKRNIEALNGFVSIQSETGRGTRFRIKLPLTMAILDGLSVSINGEVYILPLLSVVESFRPRPADRRSVLGTGELLVVRGESVPLLRLYQIFGIAPGITDPCEGLVVIVENQGQKLGLLVDELLGQLQVVMKSIEENYRKVDGISGATILGDGRVALIVDIPGVGRLARQRPSAASVLLNNLATGFCQPDESVNPSTTSEHGTALRDCSRELCTSAN